MEGEGGDWEEVVNKEKRGEKGCMEWKREQRATSKEIPQTITTIITRILLIRQINTTDSFIHWRIKFKAARYKLELTISSAKNINWRHGPLKPYAVVWIDLQNKCSTLVDEEGDESPVWDQKVIISLNDLIQDSTLFIDIVHAKAAEEIKPLIGSAKLKLKDVVDEVGIGERFADGLNLKRPSDRPQGKVEVKVYIREPRYRASDPYYAPPYGVPPPQQYHAPPPYVAPYGGGPPPQYYDQAYGQPSYGGGYKEEKKSKCGMGTGLEVGAVAGLLGGLGGGD
ncbi:hypothetical protein L6452_02525 [Arctium lappa]|uniref:Uncharacterized protein n=1 Tax=Arctium lappa TaxID=4217 RepID=A0ACB9FJL5_ARCLA|nr:hypothetical protein L6452_02525 [Arctium lappa]